MSTAAIVVTALPGAPPRALPSSLAASAELPGGFVLALHGRRVAPALTLTAHLDRSRALTFADAATARHGLTGRGVVVGVVDTGIDLSHRDFRATDGATRVAWLIDYTAAPVGLHPALEALHAVTIDGARRGAVWSASDIDPRVRTGAAPSDDTDGHGTFVAAIAASNGLATAPARYLGVAPESALVVVRAAREGSVSDEIALAGARFVFERADAMGAPAVLNLSLGGHDGAHDGDSALERALADLAPPDRPGRAIVCSAGNDRQRPIHARLSLSPGAVATVPFWTPQAPLEGRARMVGLAVAWRDGLSLAVRLPDGAETPYVSPSEAHAFRVSGALVSIANGTEGPSPRTGARTADVLIASGEGSGARRPEGAWALLLRGSGRADAYLFRDDFDGYSRAILTGDDLREEGTVTLPATSAALLSVGALRTRDGLDGAPFAPALAAFSSIGPALDGALCPDLLAPGDSVVAARAHAPRSDPASLFADRARVTPDGEHAAASGTSAAAPHVTGAVALLFQQDPALTPRLLRAALTASARPVRAAPRWNALDANGALDVLRAIETARALRDPPPEAPIDRDGSELTVAEGSVAPGDRTRVSVRLVTTDGAPSLRPHRVTLYPTLGRAGAYEDFGAGRYAIEWRADAIDAPATATLRVTVDDLALGSVRVRVEPARPLLATGGCAATHASTAGGSWGLWWALVTAARRRARSRTPASPQERPGRTARRRGPRAPGWRA